VRIDLTATGAELSPKQKAFIADFCQRYCARTKGSKAFTAKNRALLADPRVVSGFKPVYKEVVYPIVVERSKGARLWDVDGNQFVDVTCGFGANFFGHTPDWVVEAVTEQLHKGMEIGPQTPLAAEVATLVQELTGFDRVAFCNTGSEAVLGATRVCRTVTGRPLIVMFENDYHGIFDEVVVRGSKSLRSRPAAAGVQPEAVQNTLILEYGAPESLDILKSRIEDVAAVLVEPVQARHPELQPREFLHSLREITQNTETPLIFDEVVTGFRIALGGAQEYFGVRADLATYGKIVGAGMPMGIIAGKAKYMDALDGGAWQYGDNSAPSVGVTYFAGTFVRHPPAMAASRAALKRLKEDGGQVQRKLNARTDLFASELNSFFEQVHAPVRIKNFGSLWKIWVSDEESHASLLFLELRHRGVHAWEGRPAFLTMGHTEEDIVFLCDAFKASVSELIREGLLSGDVNALAALPPAPGAKLGKDPQGNPAWYVADPQRPGKYLKVEA
jgi:glutamate-1-semialdehyde aminotransferase